MFLRVDRVLTTSLGIKDNRDGDGGCCGEAIISVYVLDFGLSLHMVEATRD